MAADKQGKKRLILKLGTATLTKGTDVISRGKLEDIARQILELRHEYDFIIVSSGAIAAAKQFINLEGIGQKIKDKQALAAIGQPYLMRLMQESFRELNIHIAQCLLSYLDFENNETKNNIINTINVLINNGVIPVINENDTVATEEIKFGDNDKLAALTAELMEVDLLVLATNTYGIYDSNDQTVPHLDNVEKAKKYLRPDKSSQGTGGMQTKLDAASIALNNGIETWLVNGHDDRFLVKALEGKVAFTQIR